MLSGDTWPGVGVRIWVCAFVLTAVLVVRSGTTKQPAGTPTAEQAEVLLLVCKVRVLVVCPYAIAEKQIEIAIVIQTQTVTLLNGITTPQSAGERIWNYA